MLLETVIYLLNISGADNLIRENNKYNLCTYDFLLNLKWYQKYKIQEKLKGSDENFEITIKKVVWTTQKTHQLSLYVDKQ